MRRRVDLALTSLLAVLLVAVATVAGPPAAASAATRVPSSVPGSAPVSPGAAAPVSPGSSLATDVASVGTALRTDPLYVSTARGTPAVAAGDVRGALPPDVYVAVLPASAAGQVGGEAAAVPGALLGELQRPGTVLALVGNDLYGASRTQRADRLEEVLTDARQGLTGSGGPTNALVVAARDLTGSGQLSDAPSATRAGSPSGGGFLYVVLALVAAALLAIPLLLRRARRPQAPRSPQVLRPRVEVDAYGRIVRRVTAEELAEEQERSQGRPPDEHAGH